MTGWDTGESRPDGDSAERARAASLEGQLAAAKARIADLEAAPTLYRELGHWYVTGDEIRAAVKSLGPTGDFAEGLVATAARAFADILDRHPSALRGSAVGVARPDPAPPPVEENQTDGPMTALADVLQGLGVGGFSASYRLAHDVIAALSKQGLSLGVADPAPPLDPEARETLTWALHVAMGADPDTEEDHSRCDGCNPSTSFGAFPKVDVLLAALAERGLTVRAALGSGAAHWEGTMLHASSCGFPQTECSCSPPAVRERIAELRRRLQEMADLADAGGGITSERPRIRGMATAWQTALRIIDGLDIDGALGSGAAPPLDPDRTAQALAAVMRGHEASDAAAHPVWQRHARTFIEAYEGGRDHAREATPEAET